MNRRAFLTRALGLVAAAALPVGAAFAHRRDGYTFRGVPVDAHSPLRGPYFDGIVWDEGFEIHDLRYCVRIAGPAESPGMQDA